MKYSRLLIIPTIVILLSAAKCKKLKTEDIIESATKSTTMGGVYGSGYTIEYVFQFTNQITDTFMVDSVFISNTDENCYLKTSGETGLSVYKNKNGNFRLDCNFMGGERMQNDGEIIDVPIKTVLKPTQIGKNECLIKGTYKGKKYNLLIEKITQGENIYAP